MTEIIPAILPKDFDDLEEKLGMVAGFVPMVHVDATNGTLTPGSSWPYKGEVSNFLRIAEEAEGFPYWEELGYEVHLMVDRPEEIIEDWIKAGAERLIIHQGVFDDRQLSHFLSHLKNRFDAGSSYLGVEMGLAVNLDAPPESVIPHVLEADFIHLMSIEQIGVQGNKFNERVFDTITAIREVYPETIISVDGGINVEIAEELKERGVDRIVVGSAIFGQEDPEEALLEFLRLNA